MNLKKPETHKRTIAKTISWRIIATITTALLVFIFTGNFTMAVEVGALEAVLKLLFYYLHERGWSYIAWGTRELEG
jgi:adenylylsulfate kinase